MFLVTLASMIINVDKKWRYISQWILCHERQQLFKSHKQHLPVLIIDWLPSSWN